MLHVKKSAIALLTLGSSIAFAGTMGPVCTPADVTVPCERSAWDVGIHALYLQPVFSAQPGNYLGHYSIPFQPQQTLVDNESGWGWGYKLEASYHFNTGNDLNINWSHLNDNTRTRQFGPNFQFFGTLADLNIPLSDFESYTTSPEWDAVNVEFGQHVDFGQYTNVRFHGGLQYARMENNTHVLTTSTEEETLYFLKGKAKADGVGPRIGADMSYDLGKGLGIVVNTAAALLVGKSEIYESLSTELPNNVMPVSSGSRTVVIPEVEAKLGLAYHYPIAKGDLTIDGGYMWVNYLRTFSTEQRADTSDFGLQGPYFGLKWVGSVA